MVTREHVASFNQVGFLKLINLFYMYEYFVCIYFCVVGEFLVPSGVRRGVRSHGTGVVDSCELPSGGKKLNPGPLWKSIQCSKLLIYLPRAPLLKFYIHRNLHNDCAKI